MLTIYSRAFCGFCVPSKQIHTVDCPFWTAGFETRNQAVLKRKSYIDWAALDSRRKRTLAIKLDSTERTVDFYELLAVPRDASPAVIKAAYHRALLQSHPDKQNARKTTNRIDIALIKEAYTVLSDPRLRAAHNVQLNQKSFATVPRPAQVVSLEEFEDENPIDAAEEAEGGPWRYSCRCGGYYRITLSLMEKGDHLIACSSCSEVVWVGYELAE